MLADFVRAVAFRIEGRVQGVSFRWFTRSLATELGIRGWIRNRVDGGVEGEAFGDSAHLERFLERMKQGPPVARVDHLEWTSIDEVAVPPSFEIRF